MPSSEPRPRKGFALTGRSVCLDARRHAVRADLADIRLADQVFAPHYAEAVVRQLAAGAILCAGREAAAEPLAELRVGEEFQLLDVLGGSAWGIAPGHGLVGYIPAAALAADG